MNAQKPLFIIIILIFLIPSILVTCDTNDDEAADDMLLYTVRGKITNLSDVDITIEGEGLKRTISTNRLGDYVFIKIPAGSYTITPNKYGYTFDPTSQQIEIIEENVSGINFIPTDTLFGDIKVIIYLINNTNQTYTALTGVNTTLTLDQDNIISLDWTIDSGFGGYYSGEEITNGNYILKAEREGYTFLPNNISISIQNNQVVLFINAFLNEIEESN